MNERMAKMRGYRDKIGGLRAGLLLGVSTVALLAGCDWFEGNTPVSSRQVRPGAERSVAVSASLPAAGTGRQYDTSIAAVDETRSGGAQIGSVVAAKGGQKAQQEAMAKAALESDRKARADMERQIAQRKEEDAKVAAAQKPAGTSSSPATSEVTTQAPPPAAAPVTATTLPPTTETAAATPPAPPAAPAATPSAPPAAPVVATAAPTPPAPARPVDPNKAFEPPPGWVPPGQTAPVATEAAPPATAVATAQPAASPAPAVAVAPLPPVAGTSAASPAARSTANASTVATSTTLLPSPSETTAPIAQPPAQAAPAPAPAAMASAPTRPVDPNTAFEPPPGWPPPVQTGSVQPAAVATPAPPVASGGMATSTTLLPTSTAPTSTAPASPQVATSSLPPAAESSSVPTPSMPVRSATPRYGVGETDLPSTPADRPGFARPADVAAAAPPPAMATPPATPPVTVTATPPAAPVDLKADISRARSGEVPSSAIKSPPGGPLQVAVIQFGRASSGLGGRDSDILKSVAQIQKKNGGTVRVVAHSDQDVTGASVGQIEQGNYDVSRRRALSIANRLMALGVPRSAIVAEAASDSEPKYATNTARGIAANRRAEIFLDL